ncbi:hypothetical protein KQ302_01980 [Synechococcus sp. CS-602]|uniref:hypothetical protein n=1 Tax=Synechococcaceae TaxID=1890426 RepID=UPI0008FF3F18|nr:MULTISPECIES: hypothetical protein [Synechococcaceae]MCT4363508.1 hypothetical protein [Candidatus Regnicoccus frigidus MAG-AL1]APD48243.1 hypothetical protein BM449_08315 [Synechococcus sp. SynAce01]MCT0203501.1 hypothetical protein [Synechococcus sp. CS-603]MCT0203888.1 hypothetical protein [Synechococcus sp. CS-602]MCT0246720.1 hypothetical protein [Synechococcus sp. CS-601]
MPRGERRICRRILSALPLSSSSSANTPRTHFAGFWQESVLHHAMVHLTQFLADVAEVAHHLFTLGLRYETGWATIPFNSTA